MNQLEASKQIAAQYQAWLDKPESLESAETFVDLHSSIQHALNGFTTGTRPIHSIERLGLGDRIEEKLVLSGAVAIRQMIALLNSGWVKNIGTKRREEIR